LSGHLRTSRDLKALPGLPAKGKVNVPGGRGLRKRPDRGRARSDSPNRLVSGRSLARLGSQGRGVLPLFVLRQLTRFHYVRWAHGHILTRSNFFAANQPVRRNSPRARQALRIIPLAPEALMSMPNTSRTG